MSRLDSCSRSECEHRVAADAAVAEGVDDVGAALPGFDRADLRVQPAGGDEADEGLEVGGDRDVALEVVEPADGAAGGAVPVEEVELRPRATGLAAPDQGPVLGELVPHRRGVGATDRID